MLLDLSTLIGGYARVDRVVGPDQLPPDDDFRLVGDAELHLEVRQQGDRFSVTGHVRAPLELTCGRCLTGVPWLVDADVDLTYVPDVEEDAPPEREVGAGEFDIAQYRDNAIDLIELLREQCYLSMPMKPLCSETCQGLCPVCGGNRNRESCECQPRWDDPRLADLKRLLDDRSKD